MSRRSIYVTVAALPRMTIELTCHDCGRLVFSELVRDETLDNYGPLSLYWRDKIIEHAGRCTGKPADPNRPRFAR